MARESDGRFGAGPDTPRTTLTTSHHRCSHDNQRPGLSLTMESNETWWDIRNLVFAIRHKVGCQVAGDQVCMVGSGDRPN